MWGRKALRTSGRSNAILTTGASTARWYVMSVNSNPGTSFHRLGSNAAVSGWDDSELAQTLGFSSVSQSLYDQGVTCARIASGSASAEAPAWSLALR